MSAPDTTTPAPAPEAPETPAPMVAPATEPEGDDATPSKSLNADAKAFVPKLGDKKPSPSKKAQRPPPPPFQQVAAMVPTYYVPAMPMPVVAVPSGTRAPAGMVPVGVPMPLAPPTPAAVQVNVGNASLKALTSKEPRKFACVLVVGMPRVGKTTIGRGLVDALAKDGLSWAFFSGGDHLRDTGSKLPPWATTKDVFAALSKTLDDQLNAQTSTPVKGIIIDKQCRGTEELFFLTALLKSKGLVLNGVVGLEADDDSKLMERLGVDDDGFRERCKFHRIIQSRVRDVAKAAGLWHQVDALQPEAAAVAAVRSMVLGCSSQAPQKKVVSTMYHDHLTLVDDYEKYAQVMTTLFEMTRATRFTQFPGHTVFAPLTPRETGDKRSKVGDSYMLRRKGDGTKYVLVYDGEDLYFIPRHMRSVFAVSADSWLGAPLASLGRFALDGELVRLTKERNKEKFLVQDALCWFEKGGTTNLFGAQLGSNWKERQERLKVNLCGERSAFFGSGVNMVLVHQQHEALADAAALLEPCDYPTDGLVLQPTASRTDPVYWWRQPDTITVDFRLGPIVSTTENEELRAVEVFDMRLGRYTTFRDDTVTITKGRAPAMEGAVAICGINPSTLLDDTRRWIFHRSRSDVSTASFKTYVDDLLLSTKVSKADLLTFLGVESKPAQPVQPAAQPPVHAAVPAMVGVAPGVVAPPVPLPPGFVPTPSFFQQQAAAQQAAALQALQTAAALHAVSQATPQQQVMQLNQLLASGVPVSLPSPTVTVGTPGGAAPKIVVGKDMTKREAAPESKKEARSRKPPQPRSAGKSDDEAEGDDRKRRPRGRRGGKLHRDEKDEKPEAGKERADDAQKTKGRRGTRGGRKSAKGEEGGEKPKEA